VLDGKVLVRKQGSFPFQRRRKAGREGARYSRSKQVTDPIAEGLIEVRLAPMTPKALYLSSWRRSNSQGLHSD